MKIVLDSNVIYSDWLLSHVQFKTLERYLSWTSDELCIPEVVIEETVRHFQKWYKDVQAGYEKASLISEIIQLTLPPMEGLDSAVNSYRIRLLARIADLKARTLPLPTTTLKELLSRDLAERRPFSSTGKGFRDTLIWESILQDCAQHDEPVVIVTNDIHFQEASPDEQGRPILHEDLMRDLATTGFARERVIVRKGLQSFNQEFALPLTTGVYRQGEPTTGSFVQALKPEAILSRYADAARRDVRANLADLLQMSGNAVGQVTFLRWPEDVKIMEAVDLTSNDIQVVLRSSIVFDAELYVDNDELGRLFEATKNKAIIIMNIQSGATYKDTEVQLRMNVVADFVFLWNTKDDSAKGMDMIRIGFSEQDLLDTRF